MDEIFVEIQENNRIPWTTEWDWYMKLKIFRLS